jgi:MFS family permease
MDQSKQHRAWPWVHVVLAAMAMVMTIPSRTQGLGLITEPIINDAGLGIGRADFAWLNLIATLGGAFFALPVGWLMDRVRVRWVLILNLALLGIATWYFAQTETRRSFFIGMLLMRGLGQSALSSTSLTLIGKWFPTRVAPAMAVFGIISTIGFIIIFSAVEPMVVSNGWRNTWQMLGYMLLVLAAICLFVSRSPQQMEQNIEASADIPSTTWTQAMMSPTFWLFALSSALFNWVSSGIGLFNEDVLKEAGFTRDHLRTALGISTMVTLLSNGLAGWLSTRWSLNSLMAVGMLMLAACLLILPFHDRGLACVCQCCLPGYLSRDRDRGLLRLLGQLLWAEAPGQDSGDGPVSDGTLVCPWARLAGTVQGTVRQLPTTLLSARWVGSAFSSTLRWGTAFRRQAIVDAVRLKPVLQQLKPVLQRLHIMQVCSGSTRLNCPIFWFASRRHSLSVR